MAQTIQPRRLAPSVPEDTLGGLPLEPSYGPDALAGVDVDRDLGVPGAVPVHARHPRVDVPREAVDDAAVRRLRQRGRHQPALPVPSRPRPDRPVGGVRHAHPDGPRQRRAAVARRGRPLRRRHQLRRGHAHALRRHRPRPRHHLDDHQLAGADRVRAVPGGRRGAGGADRPPRRHPAERHPQGVHRPEGVHLPGAAVDAAGHRRGHVLRRERAALAPHLGQRVPHPRGGQHGRAGAGVHPGRRLRLRRVRGRRRPRRRRLRAAAELLLQQPHRLLRGDRQVPRRAAHLGAAHARALRRQEPQKPAAEVPHPDSGVLAHRAADREQHRAHRVRGDGRRARRHPVAAHQLDGRGAGAAHREGGADRAAHPADPRLRDRCALGGRPARRQLVHRGPHQPHGAGGGGVLRGDRGARRHRRGHRRGLPAARDRGRGVPLPVAARLRRADHRRRQRLHRGRPTAIPPTCWSSTSTSSASRRTPAPSCAPSRDNTSVATRLDALKEVAAGTDNTMPAIIDAVRARATEGEIVGALREVFGVYHETPVF